MVSKPHLNISHLSSPLYPFFSTREGTIEYSKVGLCIIDGECINNINTLNFENFRALFIATYG